MHCQTINITIETLALLLTLVLIVILLKTKGHSKQWALLLAATTLHAVNTLGDLLSWTLTSTEGMVLLTQASNFTTYFFGAAAYTAFVIAACGEFLRKPKPVPLFAKALTGAIVVCGAVNAILPLVNLQTGILFTIDASNTFTWGPLDCLTEVLFAAQIVLSLPLTLAQAEKGKRLTAFEVWVSMMALPCISLALEYCWPTLMFVYPAVALSLLLAYAAMQEKQEQELTAKKLELAESQSRMLSSQITSHFMFNSLQTVRELCVKDPARAAKAIELFSDFLRGSLDVAGSKDMVPFAQEIAHVKAYLKLEQIDTAGSFKVVWDITCQDFRIPALTVQPLVENAVRHGIGSSKNGLIRIASWEDPSGYHISVEDNGSGFTSEESNGLGIALDNVRTRLDLLCNGTLSLTSSPAGTRAAITIPLC